jgi:hypothetical protein
MLLEPNVSDKPFAFKICKSESLGLIPSFPDMFETGGI